jgi:tetratricopeptide (TPR) repeat protein
VGTLPYWQDSGLYLTAVKEFNVLYPPGFALYLCLCKAWTLLLGFVDFTLAVHLFSSLCAALAAGVLARAAENVTGDRIASSVIGCLAAAGYTWWFCGIYAKCYAFFFVFVSLLLWRMTCRDLVSVALLLGLAWAAHPSAALLGPAVLLFFLRHRGEIRAMGFGRVALATLATLLVAIGPSLALPLIAAKESVYVMGHPESLREVVKYLTGSSYTAIPGVWGFDGPRWLQMGLYAWEEFLGIGLLLAGWGVAALFRERREERWMLVCWVLPVATFATLFKIEGQYDCWLVAAWMPLWIAAGLGLSRLRARYPKAPAFVAAGGLLWAAAANGSDLYLRGNEGPERLGRSILQNLDQGSVLVLSSDDAIGLCWYLQTVRGYRSDVRVVLSSQVSPAEEIRWYLDRLVRRWPGFSAPEFARLMPHVSRYSNLALSQAAIANGQGPDSPPVFFDQEPAGALLTVGSIVPAGFLWKWTPQQAQAADPKYWSYPVTLEQATARRGRQRGLLATFTADNVYVKFQSYEDRLIYFLGEAMRNQADLLQRQGTPAGFARSAEAYQTLLHWIPGRDEDPRVIYPLGLDLYMLDRPAEAAPLFQRLLLTDASSLMKSGALFYLGEIHAAAKRKREALEFYRRALELVPAGSGLRAEIERRLGK